MNLTDKTVIVTGASSGIGEELAKRLAAKGARVVCAARRAEELKRVVGEIQSLGFSALAVPTDVGVEEQCHSLIDKAIEEYGGLDVLILNAGISMWARFDALTDLRFFRELIAVNYLGPVYCCRAALDHLKASKGLIVNCSTVQAITGVPDHTGYAASKHALHGFLESLDLEMRGEVNLLQVVLGWIRGTGLRANAFGPDGRKIGDSVAKHTSQSVPLDECVAKIVAGMESDRRRIFVPNKLKLIPILNATFRGLLRRKVLKAMDENRN